MRQWWRPRSELVQCALVGQRAKSTMQPHLDTQQGPPRAAVASLGRGAAILGGAQLLKLLLSSFSTVVLARLLSPEDFGVMAMTSPVVAVLFLCQDLGLSAVAIQRPALSHPQASALFWLNLATSFGLCAVIFVLAPMVAWFYQDPRTGYITASSAISMLVSGAALQHGVLLNRDLRFGALSRIEVTASAATVGATALLALAIHSFWAIVIGGTLGVACQSMLIWRSSGFRPSWPPSVRDARVMLRMGQHLTVLNVVKFVARNADAVLVARCAGPHAAGAYDRCFRLVNAPLQQIQAPMTRLLTPILSRSIADSDRYRRQFLLCARAVMLLAAPAICVAVATSTRLIPALLGAHWDAAPPIFVWLGLAALTQPVVSLTGILLLSAGNTRRLLYLGLVSSLLTLTGFAIGSYWGPVGIAQGYFVGMAARLPLQFWAATSGSVVSALDLWRAQIEPAVGAAAVGFVVHNYSDVWPLPVTLLVALPLSYVLSLVGSASLSREGRAFTCELLGFLRQSYQRALSTVML